MPESRRSLLPLSLLAAFTTILTTVAAQTPLDTRVQKFLDDTRAQWWDMNVPAVDGRTLHDVIVTHKYTRALEIGTSTGHSGIWIGWALSKTGGKLITIDIDPQRHHQAVENFKAAGVAQYIDARLGDAHEIVPALEGPFDFVFSDADKEWYKNYLTALLPKLSPGGCYATHNVSDRVGRGRGRRGGPGGDDYYQFLLAQPDLTTTLDQRGGGLALSYKRSGV